MPANLTPEYERADRRYRQATSDEERVAALQEMLSAIPKHKGTEKMQADLKRRLSQFRREEQKSAHGKGPDPFHIPRSGAGQIVLVGPPNSGKSSLLAATTNAEAKVAEYPFTTTVPQPGIWHQDDIPLELIDTPALTAEHVPAGLMGTIRNADLVCIVVEAGDSALDEMETTLAALSERGIRLRSKPRRQLVTDSGEHPGMLVVNKAELATPEMLQALKDLYGGVSAANREPATAMDDRGLWVLPVSAQTRQGLEEWFHRLCELLRVIRVYAKEPGKPADMHRPFTLLHGATVSDLARQIHRDLPERMKFARLWGHSRFDGQHVHKTEVLQDKDVVEIHE